MDPLRLLLRVSVLLWLLLVMSLPTTAAATAATVLFVIDPASTPSALVKSLPQGLTAASRLFPLQAGATLLQGFVGMTEPDSTLPPRTLPSVSAGPMRLEVLCPTAAVVVAVGSGAAQAVRQHCQRPTLLLALPRERADALLAQVAGRDEPWTALYEEADPVAQLPLLRAVLEPGARVGVLLSARTATWLPRLRAAATAQGLNLVPLVATTDEEAVQALRRHLPDLAAVWLIPDETLINAWSLKPILLMTARRAIPVIGGTTERYVRAGVVAARVPDPGGLSAEITFLIDKLAADENPPPRYPATAALHTVVNDWVARTLALDPERLRDRHDR